MKNKPVVIVAGEPYSVFLEIFFKSLKNNKLKNFKNPILLICSVKLAKEQMKKLKYNFNIKEILLDDIPNIKNEKNWINIFNINFKFKNCFDKISSNSSNYLHKCFTKALDITKKHKIDFLINGPISKKHFLKKKYPGMTEYFAAKTGNRNNEVMLILGKELSVSPITTHLPLRKIFKMITKKKIIQNTKIIDKFYRKYLKIKPNIAITGLNPHCESNETSSEENKILIPSIALLRKSNLNVSGPFPADTLFIKNNLKNFDVVIGMYHDQVLTPVKTIYEFKAINITLGLPFIRITPDHGPNNDMLGKNLSKPDSFIEAINFIRSLSAS